MNALASGLAERQLLQRLAEASVRDAAAPPDDELRRLYARIQASSHLRTAWLYPKCRDLRQTLGDELLLKLVCCIVAQLNAALRVQRTLSPADVIETAELLLENYPTESARDFIAAFKRSRVQGLRGGGTLTPDKVFAAMRDYLDERSAFFEEFHRRAKVEEGNNQMGTLRVLAEHLPELATLLARKSGVALLPQLPPLRKKAS
jgi:hypothetical protein